MDTSGGSSIGSSGRRAQRAWLHMLQRLLQIHSHFVFHSVTFSSPRHHAAGSRANGDGGPGTAPGHARSAWPSGAQTSGHSHAWRRSGAFAVPASQGAYLRNLLHVLLADVVACRGSHSQCLCLRRAHVQGRVGAAHAAPQQQRRRQLVRPQAVAAPQQATAANIAADVRWALPEVLALLCSLACPRGGAP